MIWRWREVLAGVVLTIWGGWIAATSLGLIAVFGWVLFGAGVVTIYTGIQRARFRLGGGGTGMVIIDEREVTYFGPLEGGSVSIEALTQVELQPHTDNAKRWMLLEPGCKPLFIPTDAEDSELLFDAFGALPGFDTQHMLHALNAQSSHPIVIWQKESNRLH